MLSRSKSPIMATTILSSEVHMSLIKFQKKEADISSTESDMPMILPRSVVGLLACDQAELVPAFDALAVCGVICPELSGQRICG